MLLALPRGILQIKKILFSALYGSTACLDMSQARCLCRRLLRVSAGCCEALVPQRPNGALIHTC